MNLTHRTRISDDDLRVHCNPGNGDPFAIISLGVSNLDLDTIADCERVIQAGEKARRLLEIAIAGTPHRYIPQGEDPALMFNCDECGLLNSNSIHGKAKR